MKPITSRSLLRPFLSLCSLLCGDSGEIERLSACGPL